MQFQESLFGIEIFKQSHEDFFIFPQKELEGWEEKCSWMKNAHLK
jgi:hypothetical protein